MKTRPESGWTWWLAVAACGALGAFALTWPLNHDVGSYLHIARAMLAGETLYVSFIEVNPPLYAYLAMIPVEMAGIFGLSAVRWMQVLLLAASLGAVLWAGWLAGGGADSSRVRGPLIAVALGLPVLGLAGVDFGQREHVMVALTAPYLVLAARRSADDVPGRPSSLAAGLLAGVGFSMKPHFIVLWVVLELALLVRSRRGSRHLLRTEVVTAAGVLAAYTAFVLLVHPEYVRLLRQLGPLYADYLSVDRLGLFANRYSVLLLVTAGAYVLCAPSPRARPFVTVFLVAAGLAFLMAVGQGKGWLYHFFPALAWTIAAAVLLAADYVPRLFDRSGELVPGRVIALVVLLAVGVLAAGSLVAGHRALAEARRAYVAEMSSYFTSAGVDSIVILSPSLPAVFPLVNYAGVQWAAPFPSLWWVEAAHAGDAPVEQSEDSAPVAPPPPRDPVEAAFLETMATGIARHPPDVVLVDTTRVERLGGRPFPYAAYLAQNPEFAAMWERYERDGTLGPFDLYSPTAAEDEADRR